MMGTADRRERFVQLLRENAIVNAYEVRMSWYRSPDLTDRDRAVMEMIEIYVAGSPDLRRELALCFRKYADYHLFEDFAGRMLERAKREQSSDLLGQAFLALVVQGFETREAERSLGDLCDAARMTSMKRHQVIDAVRGVAEGRSFDLIAHAADQQVPP